MTDATKKQKDSEPSRLPGRRPPDYVIVVSASDWLKDRFPAAGTNLWPKPCSRQRPPPRTRTRPGSRTMTTPRK